jgi:hypothetical protein
MSSHPETSAPVISLRGHRARVLYRRYSKLPCELRSPARTRLVLQAIMEYAYEPVPAPAPVQRADQDEETRICSRLQEFLPHDDESWPGGVMAWLRENQVPGAIRQRDRMAGFLGDCLRWG